MTEALEMALRVGTEPHSIIEKFRPRFVSRFLDHADCIVGIDCMVRDALFNVGTRNANYEIASTFQSGLVNGGPVVLIYGLTLSWLGSLAVGASLAEMASMQVNQILFIFFQRTLTGAGRLLLAVNTIGSLNLRRNVLL